MMAGSTPTPSGRSELAPMDRGGRLGRLRQAMVDQDLEALTVTKGENVRWLSGFTGSNGRLIITPDTVVAVTDGRYQAQIAHQFDQNGIEARIEITTTGVGEILAGVCPAGSSLGLESHHVTWKQRDQVAAWLPGRELVAVDGLVEELRKVKDGGELDRLRRAAAIADQALATVHPLLTQGLTEVEVARQLDRCMVDLGADGPSFDTIVAAGANSARPHHRPSGKVIKPGELVIIDTGARLDGYGSDMTRTFVAGDQVDSEHRRWYGAVIEAQAAGVAAVADGVEVGAVDAACRDILAAHGLAEAFVHGTGHGIGLEIHEDPILSAHTDGILRAGYVVTVEPGIYLPPHGGVRIEDSVVVGPSGCEAITLSPKAPI